MISYAVNEQKIWIPGLGAKDVAVNDGEVQPPAKVISLGDQSDIGNRRINKNNVFRLTDREKNILKEALDSINYEDSGNSDYINMIKSAASAALPKRVLTALLEQKASLQPRPYLIVDNLPMDDEVFGSPTSSETGNAYKSGHISENLAIAFASLIGEPYSISFEGIDIVNNLTPERGKEKDYTGLGSDVELDFHIENAALKFIKDLNLSPTGLVLTGVRQDPAMPKTHLADASEALRQLDQLDLESLRGDNFCLKVPYRWRSVLAGKSFVETAPAPLISGCTIQPEVHVAFYPDMVTPLNDEAARAFRNFYEAIKRVSFGVDVTPGRLVYVDNRFTLHSRDRFKANYDESGRAMRWIQRVFVTSTLWNHRTLRRLKERVFEPVLQAA
jgi:hypothetical protein